MSIACLLLFAAMVAAAQAQTKLEIIGGDSYNWGTVEPAKLKTVVELKNTGKTPIHIIEVHPTCLCTIGKLDTNFLQPGGVAHVNITMDASSRSGVVQRSIKIRYSDTSLTTSNATHAIDSLWLHLRADIHRDLMVTPTSTLIIGSAKVGVEAHVLPLKIKNTSDKPVTIYPPQLQEGANFMARFEMPGPKELKPGDELDLKSFVTPLRPGSIHGEVILKTTDKKMSSIILPAVGNATESPAANASPHQR